MGDERVTVLIELRSGPHEALALARALAVPGLQPDPDFVPVPMGAGEAATSIVRATVKSQTDVERLRRDPRVEAVWLDTPIAPFGG